MTATSQKKKLANAQRKQQEIAKKINEVDLVLKTEVGENGKLFGSITNQKIADALQESLGITIDKKRIGLHQSMHHTGSFEVPIKVYTGVNAILRLVVADKNAKKKTVKPNEAVNKQEPLEESPVTDPVS